MTPAEFRAWREHWDYSQQKLATALSVSIDTVGRWERGENPMPGMLPLALETLAQRRAAEYRERAKGPASMPT